MRDQISTNDIARGRWKEILLGLGIPGKLLDQRHQPCPFCGGKDRFRWTNFDDRGMFICNQCGSGDGFKLLMQFHGWTFPQAAKRIDDLLRGDALVSMHPRNRPKPEEVRIPKSVRDCALWLRRYHPDKLEAFLDRHYPEVRWWLEQQPKKESVK